MRHEARVVDYGRFEPAADPAFGAERAVYGSSTPYVENSRSTWDVNFFSGLVSTYDDDRLNPIHARAVRDARQASFLRGLPQGEQVVGQRAHVRDELLGVHHRESGRLVDLASAG